MTTPDFASPEQVTAVPRVVTVDLLCRTCEYNLLSLPIDGRCPECGSLVKLSTRGDLIRDSDPEWIDAIRFGIHCTIAALIVFAVGIVVAIPLEDKWDDRLPTIMVYLASAVLRIGGGWLLTAPNPSGLGEDRYGRLRRIVRVSLVCGAARPLVSFTHDTFEVPLPILRLLMCIDIMGGLASAVAEFATLRYLGSLARRALDQRLEKRARFLTYSFGGTYALVVALTSVIKFYPMIDGSPNAFSALRPQFDFVGAAAMLAMLIFGTMYLLLLGKLSKRLKEQAALARACCGPDSGAAI